ncbi:class I adenylate-forming enzyme family protein [Streptomyces sp. NPDC088785]|uniref:class I adenylate-forming enzyme family protein n=1 Tax=Streptomyces sp. NPDC088785 TaxID=3365897 RepID=UPI0037FBED85
MRRTAEDVSWWGEELVARQPAPAAWAVSGRVVTYGQLRLQVTGLRGLFAAHGIRPGSTVALRGMQSFSQLWSILALWSLGAQVLLIDPEIRGDELVGLLDGCRPQFFIAFGSPPPRRGQFRDECEILVKRLRAGRPAATDHVLVQLTSGSTGRVKAVGRTGRSLRAELDAFRRTGGMPQAADRVLVVGPMAHSFNLIGGLLHNMDVGATTVFAGSMSLPSLLRASLRSGVDTVLGTAEQVAQLARGGRALRIHTLRRALAGGAPLAPQVHTAFAERHGVRIGQAYGTTETGIIAADPTGWFGPDTVGMIAPGRQVRLVDGELQVRLERNPYVDAGASSAAFLPEAAGPAGWLRTGDLAAFDPDNGGLRIRGRIDPLRERVGVPERAESVLLAARTAGRVLTAGGWQAHLR